MSQHEKVPYEPVPDKRFAISPDGFSRERLQLIADLKTALEDTLGCRIYLSLFGSLSKGKLLTAETAPASDIDLTIFIEGEDLATTGQLPFNNGLYKQIYRGESQNVGTYGPDQEQAKIEATHVLATQAYARWYVAEQAGTRGAVMGFPETSIQANIAGIRVEAIRSDSILTAVRRADSVRSALGVEWIKGSTAEAVDARDELARFFHLNIGGGLDRHIRAFLTSMRTMPEVQAERYWEDVVQAVEYSERVGIMPENMKGGLPQTYAAACTYFRVEGQ